MRTANELAKYIVESMLSLRLDPTSVSARRGELTELAAIVETVKGSHGSRSAIDYLLNRIGLLPSIEHNDAYLSEALDYHLAILYAHLGQPERASAYIQRIGLLPSAGGEPLFSDHVRGALERHRQMMEARERGLPSILLASMPRSASASLSQSLSATLDTPILRVSAGHFPDFWVIKHWVDCVSSGGAITHDHFGASAFNLKVLNECNRREIFVLIRDPRAAAASDTNLSLTLYREKPSAELIEAGIIDGAVRSYYPWIVDWMAAERTSGLRIHWLKWDDLRKNMAGTVARILRNFLPAYPAVERFLAASKVVKANHVAGDNEAWRSAVSPAGQKYLWQTMPTGLAELLELKP
jgi:hypothetical protein